MESVLAFLQSSFPFIIDHRYLFLFLGATIEGMNTMVLGGFLISAGTVRFLPVFSLFLLGYVINGYVWYLVGYIGGSKPIDKWGRKDEKGRRVIERVERYFEKYSGRAIVLTKFTFSLTIATLIMAGSLKYNLKKFTWYNFWGSFGWVTATLFLGFFFGESFKIFFVNFLRSVTYFIVFLGSAIALLYILKWLFKSAFVKSLFLADRIKYFSEKIKDGLDRFVSDKNSRNRQNH